MGIRRITEDDIEIASAICLRSFMASVAPTLSAEGIATFRAIASPAAFASRATQDNLILISGERDTADGVLELKEGRHVVMFFVLPARQRAGVGRRLLAAALEYARGEVLTVKASLPSVAAYLAYGFVRSGDVGEVSGLVYQPLELEVEKARMDLLTAPPAH